MPCGIMRVWITACVEAKTFSSTNTVLASAFTWARLRAPWNIVTASAAAVASSSSEQLAKGRPVSSQITVWKFSNASSRPCDTSAW